MTTRGDVVTMECVDKLIRKEMVYPLTGQKLKDSDIIPLARVRLRHLVEANN